MDDLVGGEEEDWGDGNYDEYYDGGDCGFMVGWLGDFGGFWVYFL